MVPPPKNRTEEDRDGEPLLKSEIAKLRELIEHEQDLVDLAIRRQRWAWLRAFLRRYSLGTVGLVAIFAALKDDLTSLVAWLFTRGGGGTP